MMETLIELTCPYCDSDILVPGDLWKHSCSHCGKILDVSSQLAYLRGLDAFKEGQELFQKINPKKRRQFLAADREALDIFMQAYSSLQVAFKAELEENQRMLAVEMMCSMTQEFMKRLMVSPMETQYWNTLMIEQTARVEYEGLKLKLEGQNSGIWAFIKRWRWNARKNKLAQTFIQLEDKLKSIEQQIDFIDIPRARNKSWKP
jgi:hypothetical protein